jgi:hypothetical protein
MMPPLSGQRPNTDGPKMQNIGGGEATKRLCFHFMTFVKSSKYGK